MKKEGVSTVNARNTSAVTGKLEIGGRHIQIHKSYPVHSHHISILF